MDNDHGITDELREWFKDRVFLGNGWQELHDIADRIDAAYRAAYQDGENAILAVFDKRGNADVDKTMAEHGWYRALDADNVPWHIGDRDEYGNEVTSIRMAEDGCFYFTAGGALPCRASIHRHYHKPTVEDVLREFAQRWDDPTHYAKGELVEQYASKLRLAGGDAE